MKQSDWLSALFGSTAMVKLLRLFLFNPSTTFTLDEILGRARLSRRAARTELSVLERIEIVKRRQVYGIGAKGTKRRMQGFVVNTNFPKLQALQTFLFETTPLESKTVLRHMRKAGRLDTLVIAGIFSRNVDARLDLVVVAKKLLQGKIESAVRTLEAELGIEIRFATFTTDDFLYRIGMYDKLTRDVFDYPHQILVDRIGVRDSLRTQTSVF